MQFGLIPVSEAIGAILAHAHRAGAQRFNKGRILSAADVVALRQSGVSAVMAARLEPGDLGEDAAATAIATALAGPGVRVGAAFTGRANLYAEAAGLVLIEEAAVAAVNATGEAITLATLPAFSRVVPRQMLATVKIIPFAVAQAEIAAAQACLSAPTLRVAPFIAHRVALISTALPATTTAMLDKNRSAIAARIEALGSSIAFEQRVAHSVEALAPALQAAHAAGCAPILVFGASAITDRRDIIPTALMACGGEIVQLGMPVDPGNLLLLGTLDGTAVLGLPGCARSPKLNGADFVLWRLLAGQAVTRQAIVAMGVGGLLAEILSRPQPREGKITMPAQPRIEALVLAAGRSMRMGDNKLLATLQGAPLVRRSVTAALASHVRGVTVVTGHQAEALHHALADLPIRFVHNPDYAQGLSTSLKAGLLALPEDCDGVLVLLADMPDIDNALLDRLIAAFSPDDGRAICIATRHGKRGNPVLWARRFFADMMAITGDVGARALLGTYAELLCEVEAGSDAPLTDLDTPDALAAWQARHE